MVPKKKNIDALNNYRNSMVTYRRFEDKNKTN